MKKLRTNNIILKAGAILLSCSILFSSFLWIAPMAVSAAETKNAATEAAVSYYPHYEMPEYILGKVFLGTEGLTDPVSKQYSDDKLGISGTYYEPTTYIYFGSYYDLQTERNIPLVHRVLDADADNAGNGGAIFVLSEFASAYKTAFAYNGETNNEFFTNDNIYSYSVLGNSTTVSRYAGSNYGSKYKSYYENIPSPRDYVRKITKEDVHAQMQGLFGFYDNPDQSSFRWDINVEDSTYGLDAESAQYLTDATFFPLSAKEFNDYVSTVPFAPGVAVTHINSDEYAAYWLRTGLEPTVVGGDIQYIGQHDETENGNNVGAVDGSGAMIAMDSDDKAAVRYGFNIETADIVFTQILEEKTHRLAFIEPLYKNTDTPFEAELIDIKGDVVTVKYKNVILDGWHESFVDENYYLSVMIKDKDGNITHYGSVAEMFGNSDCRPDFISDREGTASFRLPEEYKDGDKVYVFWERKNEYMQKGISHVSNMVDLGCIHVPETRANCSKTDICAKCGEAYGEVDPENHTFVDTTEYFFDEIQDIHWNVCSECNERVNVTACLFGSSCVYPCVCGNQSSDSSIHDFNENGICIGNNNHFEMPDVSLSINPHRGEVHITNEGQLIALAKLQNSGAFISYHYPHEISVFIDSDLDFSGIDGYEPIGTAEYPFYGTVYGNSHTIKGISYSSSDNENVGIFGVAAELAVSKLNIAECRFEGKDNAGVILGQSIDGGSSLNARFSNIDIINCTVNAISKNGNEGIIVGKAHEGDTIYNVYSYNIINSDSEYVRLASNESIMDITSSVYLYSESGEFARTAEQYASGQVAHEQNMRQEIGVDIYPSHNTSKPKVGRVSYCDGDLAYYTNERLSVHLPMDRTIHEPTEFYGFVWDGSFAQASVYCDACKQNVLVKADVEEDYSYVPVRGDYTASITVGGQTYTESITIIGIHIEDMIGMTNIVKDFDGNSVYPEELMNNHRLDDGSNIPAFKEYEVYFVDPETGERYQDIYYDYYGQPKYTASSVSEAGIYDLLVIGKNDYSGQEYTYKGALVINHVTVTVTPEDVYKYYDGSKEFVPEFTVDAEGYEYGIKVEYSSSESAEVGDYILNVSLKVISNEYRNSVTYVLSNDTVMGYIFPEFSVTVENKSYPTEFTYGEMIPEPEEKYFNFTEGTTLSFEWFKADWSMYEFEVAPGQNEEKLEIYSMSRIYEMPKDAGKYILRVRASHIDSMVGNYIEIPIRIRPKILSVELVAPDGKQPVENEYGNLYYYLDMGEKLVPRVWGLPEGETLESAGVEISIYQYDAVYSGSNLPEINNRYDFPTQPNKYDYQVSYTFSCSNKNYAFDEDGGNAYMSVSVCINGADAHTPVLGESYIADGLAKEIGVVFSWNAPETDDLSDVYYTITIKREGEEVGYHERRHSDFISNSLSLTHPVSLAGEYTAEIVAARAGETINTQTVNFSVAFDMSGEMLDSIEEMGEYTVIVTSDGDVRREVELVVKREIVMKLKESDYFISEGTAIYDKTDIVMEAGKVILLGHELVDIDIDVDIRNGTAAVRSMTVRDSDGKDVSHLYYVTSGYTVHSAGGLGVAHIYDSPCDTTCNVYGCESTRAAAHTGGVATCTSLAICESCNMEYGSYATHRHTCEHTHIAPNPDDIMTHIVVHPCCGLIKEIKGHIPETVATCTDRAVCKDCGWKYGEIDPDNHTSEEFTYKSCADNSAGHIKIRACCGEEIFEEHTGGNATCSSLAKCEFCSEEYGELDSLNHSGEITYTPDLNNGSIHSAHCAACNVTWTESHVGGEATCSTLAVCESCNASYGELDAENHESEATKYVVRSENPSMHDKLHSCCDAYISKAYHSGGEANCASAALCELCGEAYGQKNPENHASDEFKYTQSPVDINSHIKYHKCCGTEIAVEDHTGADTATCEHANICEACGLEYGEKLEHVYDNVCDAECNTCQKQTRGYVFHADENGDQKCDNCSAAVDSSEITDDNNQKRGLSGAAISGIATGSAVALGAGGFSVFWFVIKKRSLAELLKLLIG